MNDRFSIIGLGELLWDLFPDGPRFGGAPVNFSCHAAALGANVSAVTSVGNDDLGRQAVQALKTHGVKTDGVALCTSTPTGTVAVTVDAAGKATFRFAPDVAWDHLEWSATLERLAGGCHAVCFGTLAQRSPQSRQTIQRFVRETPTTALRIFDINLRPPCYEETSIRESLGLANVLKLNDDELPILAAICGVSGTDAEIMTRLAKLYDLDVVALTRGPHGAILLRGGETSETPGVSVAVKDTVGAGDAFTAAMALGLLRHDPLDTIDRRACAVAAYVCSCSGATPELPAAIKEMFAGKSL